MVNQILGVLGVFASRKGGCSVHKMIACRAIIWFYMSTDGECVCYVVYKLNRLVDELSLM